jgi:hypothetical protein
LNQYGDWYIIPVNVIDYDTVELECNKEKIRQGALKKLSKEEKEALGLTGP